MASTTFGGSDRGYDMSLWYDSRIFKVSWFAMLAAVGSEVIYDLKVIVQLGQLISNIVCLPFTLPTLLLTFTIPGPKNLARLPSFLPFGISNNSFLLPWLVSTRTRAEKSRVKVWVEKIFKAIVLCAVSPYFAKPFVVRSYYLLPFSLL